MFILAAYEEGYEAMMRGLNWEDNPYPEDSEEHYSWNQGYGQAQLVCEYL